MQQAAGGTQAARGVFNAESDQIARTELEIELLARGVDFEFPQRTTAQAAAPLNQRGFGKVFRVQQFGGVGALELRRHCLAVSGFAQAKTSGANIEGGVAKTFTILPDGGQQIILTFLQQRFIADSSGGHNANDFAFNRPFSGRRIANLFANGHRLPLINQLGEIVLHRMMRDPGHRNRFACGSAAFGQRDIKQLRCAFRIVIEEFVKITHPVKQQDLRMLGFQLEILLHHGRMGVKIL